MGVVAEEESAPGVRRGERRAGAGRVLGTPGTG
jgi:hypothetical protein